MPIYNIEKRLRLRELGLDPDSYEEIPSQEPAVSETDQQSPATKPTSNVTSWWGAGLRQTLRDSPATYAGLTAGASVGETATLLAAPTGPFAPVIGGAVGLAAFLGTAGLAKYAQNAIIKQTPIADAYKKSEETDVREHPYATTIGSILSARPYLAPSAQPLRELLKGTVGPATKNALASAAVQGGIGYGQEAFNQGTLTPDLDLGQLGLSALGAGILNKPTARGIALGLHEVTTPKEAAEAAKVQAADKAAKVEQQNLTKAALEKEQKDLEEQSRIAEDIKLKASQAVEEEKQRVADQATKDAEVQQVKEAKQQAEIAAQNKIAEDAKTQAAEQVKLEQQRAEEYRLKQTEEQNRAAGKLSAIKPPENVPAGAIPPEVKLSTEPQQRMGQDYNAASQQSIAAEAARVSGIANKAQREERARVQAKAEAENEKVRVENERLAAKKVADEEWKRQSNAALDFSDAAEKVQELQPGEVGPKFGEEVLPKQKDYAKGMRAGVEENASKPITPAEEVQAKFDKQEEAHFLDKYKIDTKGKLYGGIEGLGTAAWNGSIDAIKLALKAGKSIGEAISHGIKWIKANHPGMKFNEADYRTHLEGRFSNENSIKHLYLNEEPSQYSGVHKLATPVDEALIKNSPVPLHGMREMRTEIPETSFKSNNLAVRAARGIAEALKSDIDRVKEHVSKPLGDAFNNFFDTYTRHYGALVNKYSNDVRKHVNLDHALKALIAHPKDYLRQRTGEMDNVMKYYRAKQDKTTAPILTANEVKVRDATVDAMRTVDDMVKARKGMKKSEPFNSDNFANMVSPKVVEILQQKPKSPEALKLKKDMIDYQLKQNPALNPTQAEEIFNTALEGFSSKDFDTAKHFAQLDSTSAFKIPESWQNPNLLDSMSRFLNRAARRFAYEDTLSSKPIQDELKTYKDTEHVKAVYQDISGNKYYDNPKVNNLMGFIRALRLGPLTGVKDLASGMFLGLQHHEGPFQAVKNIVKSLGDMKQNIADAYETGRIRQHMNGLEVDNGMDDMVHWLKRFRDIASDLSARNWFDKIARALAFGDGRLTTIDYLAQLSKGKLSRQGQDWFKNFGEGTDWKSGNLNSAELKQIAARYVDSVQGTYDRRGLNKFVLDSSLSPILSLSRWNIEKANNFIKYTVKPLQEGNPKPLLLSTVGIVAGGAVVNAMVEAITGRKRKEPTYGEISEAPNKIGPSFYKAAGLASAAGHIGIIGDVFKSIMDVTYGSNRPQAINNVLIDAAQHTATIAGNWAHSTLENGLDPEVTQRAVSEILMDNFQAYRLGLAYMSADTQKDIDRANKFRDLRTFNLLQGNGVSDQTSDFNVSLDDVKLKKFKRSDNLEEARAMLPELIQHAIDKAGNNPEKLKQELEKMKKNSYQSMPNPRTLPDSFSKYLIFLKETQGEDVMKDRLLDYVRQNIVNKAKVAGL